MRKLVSYLLSSIIVLVFVVLSASPNAYARDPGVAGTPDDTDAAAVSTYCEASANPSGCDSCLAVAISYGAPSQAALSGLNCSTKGEPDRTSCQLCQSSGFISSIPDTVISNIYDQKSAFAGADATGDGTDVGDVGASATGSLDGKGAGVQSKFEIPGITCGSANNPPYDKCCLPTVTQVSCVIQDLKVVSYPKKSSWFNPINWTGNVIKSGATLAQNAGISTLCGIFKDQLGRRIEKIDSAVFQNPAIPEVSSTVKTTGYCIPDPSNPNVRPVGEGDSCTCVDDSVDQTSENFGANLCARIAPNDTDTCLSCANIALASGMNCSSEGLSSEQQQTCNSCTSRPFYVNNATTFQSMGKLGDQGRDFCQGVPPGEYDSCVACMIPSVYGISGIWTSFGCMQTNPTAFISQTVIPVGISLGAAAAFMTILYSAYLIQTSQGNPEKLKKARAYLNTSLIGLMLIIFAALILQIIGIDILRIPGLG